MKGKLREDATKYVPYYRITSLSTHFKQAGTVYYFISDSCPGQNRNHTVVRLLATLASNGKFNKTFQYFPVRDPETAKLYLSKTKFYTK
jgi:hypothetical protein